MRGQENEHEAKATIFGYHDAFKIPLMNSCGRMVGVEARFQKHNGMSVAVEGS